MANINDVTFEDIAGSGYIDEHIIYKLQQNGIIKLSDLLKSTESELRSFKNLGTSKITKILSFIEDVINNPDKYVQYKMIHNTNYYLPIGDYIKNSSLYLQTKAIFEQLVDLLEKKGETRLSNIIRLYYGVNCKAMSDYEISERYNITTQAIQITRSKFTNSLFNGESIYKIQLSEEFLYAINIIKNEVIYKDELVFRDKTGFVGEWDEILSVLSLYDLEVVKVTEQSSITDQCFLCGTNEVVITRNHVKLLYQTISSHITPISYENLYPLLESNAEKNKIDIIREDIIKSLLVEHKWIETINGEYQISYSQLFSETQKVGRIIFENKSITLDDILTIYNQRVNNKSERKNSTSELHLSILKKNDNRFFPQAKSGVWNFSEEKQSLRPIKEVIAELVESQVWVASFNDFKIAIQRDGLDYSDISLRAYISSVCTPCIDDSNLFCHKEHTNEYPQINWRAPQMYGRENWIINTVVEILKETPNNRLAFSLIKQIANEKVKNVGYDLTHIRNSINLYEGNDNLFSFDKNNNLTLNLDILDVIDLDKIGKKNRTPLYYMELASFIINHLRKQESGIALLRDVMNLSEGLIPFGNTIPLYQKLVSKFSEIEIIKQGERLYIQLCKDIEFVAEETHVIAPEKIIEIEQVIVAKVLDTNDFVTDTRKRNKVNARLAVNWDELIQIMSKELGYYSRWMPVNITLQEAINKFKNFLISTENSNLSSLIPQDIYDYWTCQIDRFDKYHYLGDICTNYEKLLKSIYYNNNGIKIDVTGLRETITYYPEFDLALKVREKNGFIKILNNLWTSRNIINHGEELEISNLKMDMAINEYIALYVYTIAKYVISI